MEKFFKDRFYPQNFLMVKGEESEAIIEKLSDEAAKLVPDFFDAQVNCFYFVLRYQPPYSELTELKRMQYEAIKHTRFKDEYRGFIAVDLSEWTSHFEEEFFSLILTFLRDMSESWKYIFLLNDKNSAARIKVIFENNIPAVRICDISGKRVNDNSFVINLIDETANAYKKTFTPSAVKLLQDIFKSRSSSSDRIIKDAAKDIAAYFFNETELTDRSMAGYLLNEFTYLNFYMTQKEKMLLNDYVLEEGDKR